MRHQNGNECLLGACSDGYKCDCFGFEHCTISRCAIYTIDENAVPSDTNPFQCHLTPDAGKCTTFEYFLDTLSAADNAKAEGTTSTKEITAELIASTGDIQAIVAEKAVVDSTVEALDDLAEQVTEDERADIDREMELILKALKDARAEETEMEEDASEARRANNQVGYFRRLGRRREAEAKAKEEEEKIEAAKPKNKQECNRCEVPRKEIRELRKQRKQAAIEAGTWTKKVQGSKNRAKKHRKNVNRIRLSAEEARKRCIARSEKILARIRG